MTWEEIKTHAPEIRALFRSWTENLEGKCPTWMDPAEYELMHLCIREARNILRDREVLYEYSRSS